MIYNLSKNIYLHKWIELFNLILFNLTVIQTDIHIDHHIKQCVNSMDKLLLDYVQITHPCIGLCMNFSHSKNAKNEYGILIVFVFFSLILQQKYQFCFLLAKFCLHSFLKESIRYVLKSVIEFRR